MATWQAHLAAFLLRKLQKPRLARARNVVHLRQLMQVPPSRLPSHVRITAGHVAGIPGEWMETSDTAPTLLYVHGGGYLAMSPQTHRPITAAFAAQGFRVFTPQYRLAPEHPFPAAIEDVVNCYRQMLRTAGNERGPVLAGDSSGGGLAVAVLLSLREAGAPLPPACVLFSPWTDLAVTGESIRSNTQRCALFRGDRIAPWAKYYLGAADPRHPLASPLYADLHGLPELLIHVGADEVLLDDSTRFAERARAAHSPVTLKIWPVVPHGWQLVQWIPEAQQSIREASEFLHRALAKDILAALVNP